MFIALLITLGNLLHFTKSSYLVCTIRKTNNLIHLDTFSQLEPRFSNADKANWNQFKELMMSILLGGLFYVQLSLSTAADIQFYLRVSCMKVIFFCYTVPNIYLFVSMLFIHVVHGT
jgi:hypothetical protein